MLIVAVDPSLTATGMTLVETGPEPIWHVGTIKSVKNPIPGERGSLKRMMDLSWAASEWIDEVRNHGTLDAAVIEAPAYSKSMGMAHERAGLWWHLYGMLTSYQVDVRVIKPNLRAKYATGRGNAGKDEVMLAAAKRYAECLLTNNNEADAVVLAAMEARLRDEPVEPHLPGTHTSALRTLLSPSAPVRLRAAR